jgi:hypothetical protein
MKKIILTIILVAVILISVVKCNDILYNNTKLLLKYNLYKLIINKISLYFRLFWYRFGISTLMTQIKQIYTDFYFFICENLSNLCYLCAEVCAFLARRWHWLNISTQIFISLSAKISQICVICVLIFVLFLARWWHRLNRFTRIFISLSAKISQICVICVLNLVFF